MIKYAILSTASIVPRFVKAINQTDDACVYCIASRSLEKAKKKAKELGIEKYYGSYEEVYSDPLVDCVYIATINFAHYKNIKDALNAGKNVICEKPLVLKKEEAIELFDLAKKKGLYLAEAQKEVFLPITKKIKEIIENKTIGDVTLLDFATSFPSDYNDWTLDLSKGGGVFFTNAVYSIEYIEYIFNKPISQYSGMRLKSEEQGGDSQCALSFKIGNEAMATSRISGLVKTINRLYVFGTKGYIIVDDFYKADTMTIHYHENQKVETFKFETNSEMAYEFKAFNIDMNENKLTSDVITKEMTIHSCEILEEIQKTWVD